MKIARRVSALVLSFLMILTMMPSVAQTVRAEGETATITFKLGDGKGVFNNSNGSNTYTETLYPSKDYYGNSYYNFYDMGDNYTPSGQQIITGWVDESDSSKVYPAGTTIKVTKSTNLVAQWEDAWKITLHGNGGTFDKGSANFFYSNNYTYNKTLDQYVKNSCYIGVDSNDNKSAIAYVKKGNSLSIGTGADSVSNADSSKALVGWAANSDGSGEVVSSSAVSQTYTMIPDSDKDLYAVWGTGYNVTLKAGENGQICTGYDNSGKSVLASEISKTVAENTNVYSSIKVVSVSYADNTKRFVGWKDQNGKYYSNLANVLVTSNLTLTAQYADAVKVTIKSTDDAKSPNDTMYVAKGSDINMTAASSGRFEIKEKYENGDTNSYSESFTLNDSSKAFAGLKITNDAGTDITSTITTIDQNITVEPVVTAEAVKLDFDLQGAYPRSGFENIYTGKNVSKGVKLSDVIETHYITDVKSTIKENSGKLCVGFTTVKNDASTLITAANISTIKLDSATTLYALFTDDVKVTFDANGGYLYGNPSVTSDYDYYRKDGKDSPDYWQYRPSIQNAKRTFNGYSKEKNGKALTFDQLKAELMTDSIKSLTLYASWLDSFIVTYDANGGYFKTWDQSTSGYNKALTIDRTVPGGTTTSINYYIPYSDNPHYIFDGWVIDGTKYSTRDSLTVNSDIRAYANWIKASVITYDFNGQTLPNNATDYDKYATVKDGEAWAGMQYSNSSTPEGKAFVGFTTVKDDINTLISIDNPLMVNGDTTVYAYYAELADYTYTWGDGYYMYFDGDNAVHAKEPISNTCAAGSKIIGLDETVCADDDSKAMYGFTADGVTYEARPTESGFKFVNSPIARDGLTLNAIYTDKTKYTINYNGKTIDGKNSIDMVDAKGRTLDKAYMLSQEVFEGTRDGNYIYLELGDAMDAAELQDQFVGFSLTADGTEMISNGYKLDSASTIYMIWKDTVIGTPTDAQAATNADRAISTMTDSEVKDLASSATVPTTKDAIYKKAAAISKVATDNNGKIDPKNFSIPNGSTVNIKAIEEVKNANAISSFKTVLTSIVGNISKENATVQKTELFDINATGKGKVMIYVGKEYAGLYSIVGHYNSGNWTTQQCKIDVNGYVTPAFNSFSPVFVAVTTSTTELASVATNEPAVVAAQPNAKSSPKTGIPAPSNVQVILLIGLAMLGAIDLIEMLRKRKIRSK